MAVTTPMGRWISTRASFERGRHPATELQRRDVLRALMAGTHKAVTEVFDPYFAKTARAGHTPKAFEMMIRGMHSRIAETGYAGFMGRKAGTTAIAPGVMLKDLKPADYTHPHTVWLDADSRPLLIRLREEVAIGTHWKTAFDGLAENLQPHNTRKTYTGTKHIATEFVSHEYAPVEAHAYFLARCAEQLKALQVSTTSIQARGGLKVVPAKQARVYVDALHDFYRHAMAPQFFPRINNSIFIPIVNRLLTHVKAAQISPGMLDDYAAIATLQESRAAFRQQVLETNPGLKGWRAFS